MLGARGFLAHKAMAALAGIGVVVVAGLLGRRLAGPRVGLNAAALVALCPDLWIVDGTLWPEGLYTALIGLALLGTYRWLDQPTLPRAALVGAAIGRRSWGALGRRYAGQHRDRWPAVVTARVLRVWDLAHADTTARALTFEGRAYEWARRGLWAYRAVLIPGLIALAVLWRRRQVPVWPLVAMGAMVAFTAAAVYGHIRFRTVGDLVLLVGAAVAFGAVLPGRSRGPEPAPARAATVPEAT